MIEVVQRARREIHVTLVTPPAAVLELFVHYCPREHTGTRAMHQCVTFRESDPKLGPEQDGWCHDLGEHPKRLKRFVNVTTCPHCGKLPGNWA